MAVSARLLNVVGNALKGQSVLPGSQGKALSNYDGVWAFQAVRRTGDRPRHWSWNKTNSKPSRCRTYKGKALAKLLAKG